MLDRRDAVHCNGEMLQDGYIKDGIQNSLDAGLDRCRNGVNHERDAGKEPGCGAGGSLAGASARLKGLLQLSPLVKFKEKKQHKTFNNRTLSAKKN